MDIATGTVYFVFKNGRAYCSLGVSHESYGSKVFLEVFTVKLSLKSKHVFFSELV